MSRYDARQILKSLQGQTIRTLTGRPNEVLRLDGDQVFVATGRSPGGQPVPIEWVQSALDRLEREGAVVISVESVGYRSAFIGAVLSSIPGVLLGPGIVRLPGPRVEGRP